MKKRIVALFLALLLAISITPALAADTQQPVQEAEPDAELTLQGEDIPSRYDSRDYGYVTPVREQIWGNCWAHAVCACMEVYMIKHQFVDWHTGQPATADSLNLSEFHLNWFAFTDAVDRVGMLEGERTWVEDGGDSTKAYYRRGGTDQVAALTMMRWEGPASEREPDLAYSKMLDSVTRDKGIDPKYAYTYDVAHLSDWFYIPIGDTDAVKTAIMEYGAASFDYFPVANCMNKETGAYCYKEDVGGSVGSSFHGVACVGWDDHYSRYNFLDSVRPSRDGAWIIKNSYGEGYGDKGYMYISYEDEIVGREDSTAGFFVLESYDNYDNNYQYDGTISGNWLEYLPAKGSKAANVFTSHGLELLKAASIYVTSAKVDYELAIYTNLSDPSVPDSGTLALEQGGSFEYSGFHTVKLKKPVPLSYGESFAVVFTFYSNGSDVKVSCDMTDERGEVKALHNVKPTSFSQKAGETTWYAPLEGKGNFHFKAYTDYCFNSPSYSYFTEKLKQDEYSEVTLGNGMQYAILCQGSLPGGMYLSCDGGQAMLSGNPAKSGSYQATVGLVADNEDITWCSIKLDVESPPEPIISPSDDEPEPITPPSDDEPEPITPPSDDVPEPIILPFVDVPETAWYHDDVSIAYQTGLINGKDATHYRPDDHMTCAEAVKLAACMHQLYTTGSVTLTNGEPWYQSYEDYTRANGIITGNYDWNRDISRAEYVNIFAHALPEEAFTVINTVANNAIPDVAITHYWGPEIYKLYRAGILTGTDSQGTFNPDSSIKRSEVSAILTRMMHPEARQHIYLP